MTEADWLACADPAPMLDLLQGRVSDRKWRLFACACCRRVWSGLTDARSRRAVETAERYADGRATPRELGVALRDAVAAAPPRRAPAAWAAYWATNKSIAQSVRNVVTAASDAVVRAAALDARVGKADELAAWNAGRADESREQARLLREVVGDPFRPTSVDPGCLAWNDGAVRKMARVILDERRFRDLPLLADAAEEGGYADDALLTHLRVPGDHVPGCFALDLLAGFD